MASYTRVAAVTGSNKGIGLACVRQLALQYPKSGFNNGSLLIYLTARSKERGEAALKTINADSQLTAAKALKSQGGLTEIKYLQLDIDSKESITKFCSHIKEAHPEGIDILINNAGVALDGFNSNVVKSTLHCNYYGTLEATEQLLPHIRDGGRLVNVASVSGNLTSKYSPDLKKRFLAATKTSEITELMEEFTKAVEADSYQGTWPGAAYAVSKCGVIGLTRTVARENKASGSNTLVNCCCPGYVNTDMTKGNGTKTVDEGAMTPVLLALGDIGKANGEFWKDGKKIEW